MTGVGAVDDDVLVARAYLSRVCEPACVPLWGFVDQVGPVEAADAIRRGTAPRGVNSAAEARRDHTDPHADLEAAERLGVRLSCPESDDWPHFALAALYRLGAEVFARYQAGERRRGSGEHVPPIALWLKGNGALTAAATRSVAIVGARASTAYGEHVTADLGYGLARAGVTVVSGGAHGIDATAHRSALAADGDAVLVSAGGLDRAYPPANAPLFDGVAATGVLVSESPPGTAPQRHRFLSRNRLIAAFSTATLVVEATSRSGAANTASHATAMGRPLLAVPGPITSPLSAGCHALLRLPGTVLVAGLQDVLAVVGQVGEGLSGPEGSGGNAEAGDIRGEVDVLDPIARQVFEALPARRYMGPEELSVRSGVPLLDVIRALPALEVAVLAESEAGAYRVAGRVRGPRPAARA